MHKYKYLILITFIITLSCTESETELLKKKTTELIIKNANNPKSYELVEFKIIDTLEFNKENDETYKSISKSYENYKRGIKGYESGLKILDRAISEGKADKNDILKGKIIRRVLSKGKIKMDSFSNLLSEHKTKYFNKKIYKTKHKFRINNAFNAPILHEYIFIIGSDYEILDVDKTEANK